MTQGQLTEILAADDCYELAKLRAHYGGYYDMPIRAIAKRYGLDSYELRTLVGSGLNVAGVRVSFDAKTEKLIFRAQKSPLGEQQHNEPAIAHESRGEVPRSETPVLAGPFAKRVEAESLQKVAQQEWERSEELRAEFGTFGAYFGWRKAEAEGKAKIFAGGTVKRYERPATGQ